MGADAQPIEGTDPCGGVGVLEEDAILGVDAQQWLPGVVPFEAFCA